VNQRRMFHLVSLAVIALGVRLVTLTLSPLPYNIDGFPLARLAEDIIAKGGFISFDSALAEYNAMMPAFPALLASFSMVLGVEPIVLLPYFVPLATVGSVFGAYLLTLKMTKSETAAMLAGLVLALNGFFIYLTTAAMKEALALALLPALYLLFHQRASRRKRLLATSILLILPLLHHLTTIIVHISLFLVIVAEASVAYNEERFSLKKVFIDLLFAPILGLWAFWYYSGAGLGMLEHVTGANDIALLASVVALNAVFCILLSFPQRSRAWFFVSRKGKYGELARVFDEKVLIFVVGIGLLVLTHYLRPFGTLSTTDAFMVRAIPYLVMTFFALLGFNISRITSSRYKPLVAALLLGPLAFITFALLRGLDPVAYTLLYRSVDYIDIALAVCAGIGMAYLVKKLAGISRKEARVKVTAALLVLVFLIPLSTVPLAYDWKEVYGLESVTQPYELDAMAFISEHREPDYRFQVGTDKRLGDISSSYFGLTTDPSLPFRVKYGQGFASSRVILTEERWEWEGAEEGPLPPVEFDGGELERFYSDNSRVYSGGPSGDGVYVWWVG